MEKNLRQTNIHFNTICLDSDNDDDHQIASLFGDEDQDRENSFVMREYQKSKRKRNNKKKFKFLNNNNRCGFSYENDFLAEQRIYQEKIIDLSQENPIENSTENLDGSEKWKKFVIEFQNKIDQEMRRRKIISDIFKDHLKEETEEIDHTLRIYRENKKRSKILMNLYKELTKEHQRRIKENDDFLDNEFPLDFKDQMEKLNELCKF